MNTPDEQPAANETSPTDDVVVAAESIDDDAAAPPPPEESPAISASAATANDTDAAPAPAPAAADDEGSTMSSATTAIIVADDAGESSAPAPASISTPTPISAASLTALSYARSRAEGSSSSSSSADGNNRRPTSKANIIDDEKILSTMDEGEIAAVAAIAAANKGGERSVANVSAIVNEVLRLREEEKEKENAIARGGGTTSDDVGGSMVAAAAAANDGSSRRPSWNREREDETRALFARDREDRIAAALISSRIEAANANVVVTGATGGRRSGRGNGSGGNHPSFDPNAPPDYDDLLEELGIDPRSTSPWGNVGTRSSPYHYRMRYFRPEAIARSPRCHYVAIVLCLAGIAVSIASAVTKGFERASKRKHALATPMWVKEEELDNNGGEVNLDWWSEENADEDADDAEGDAAATTTGSSYYDRHHVPLSEEEADELDYIVSDAYLPIWYDRGTGWKGQSYQEAMDFCREHDDFVPCPYEVYCPGRSGHLIFGERFEDPGESWAPVLDHWNEWVQVGNGRHHCLTYSGVYERSPMWGTTGVVIDNEKVTRHIMCCLEQPLGSSDLFETPEVPMPGSAKKEDVAEKSLTPLEQEIYDNYNPFWLDVNSGWNGTTYEDGVGFCESIPSREGPDETFHLCPIKAHCPEGPNVDKLYGRKPFEGEGAQWSPVSNAFNSWVMVGHSADEEHADVCKTHRQSIHRDPDWGVDGSRPELMKHILCCQIYSATDGGMPKGEIPIVQIAPNSEEVSASQPTDEVTTPLSSSEQDVPPAAAGGEEDDGAHTGAGNSSPHVGQDYAVSAMKRALDPVWFDSDQGWAGGSHDDALSFCGMKDRELCPYAAYCPHGPTFPALEGRDQSAGESSNQWAPTINGHNEWVLIGTRPDEESTQCMDYMMLNGGGSPSWGLDESMSDDKRHVLCCDKSEFISAAQVQHQQGSATETESLSLTSQNSEETIPDTDPAMQTGIWFHIENGWNGGSHVDATHFCSRKEVNGKQMELCRYEAYCPSGPSRPPADGLGEIRDGEESEQWAPMLGDDEWVMVGVRGHNKVVQCLTHEQLYADDLEVDLIQAKKRYIMCCESL